MLGWAELTGVIKKKKKVQGFLDVPVVKSKNFKHECFWFMFSTLPGRL